MFVVLAFSCLIKAKKLDFFLLDFIYQREREKEQGAGQQEREKQTLP